MVWWWEETESNGANSATSAAARHSAGRREREDVRRATERLLHARQETAHAAILERLEEMRRSRRQPPGMLDTTPGDMPPEPKLESPLARAARASVEMEEGVAGFSLDSGAPEQLTHTSSTRRGSGFKTTPSRIFVARHADRLDRAIEKSGGDWISHAARPQDPPLSVKGRAMAHELGKYLAARQVETGEKIAVVFASPFYRTVKTADIVCEHLGLGPNSICVEPGLCEEVKSFRGRQGRCPPRAPWILRAGDLTCVSDRIDLTYKPFRLVDHARDAKLTTNFLREVNDKLPRVRSPQDEAGYWAITYDRVREMLGDLLHAPECVNKCVLMVSHGATTRAVAENLQARLPAGHPTRITGKRTTACVGEFVPAPAEFGPWTWTAVQKTWQTEHLEKFETIAAFEKAAGAAGAGSMDGFGMRVGEHHVGHQPHHRR